MCSYLEEEKKNMYPNTFKEMTSKTLWLSDIHAGHWGIASHPDLIALPIRNYIQKLTA